LKKTVIIERDSIQLENPVLIEGLPGLGMVGRIAVKYLVKKLKAKPFAHLYSPHFPYYVIVNSKGNIRLLGIARFKGLNALCLLGETRGYMPDPKAAKSVLNALCKILELNVDLSGLDVEIERAEKLLEKMHQIEARRESYIRRLKEEDRERTSYIS